MSDIIRRKSTCKLSNLEQTYYVGKSNIVIYNFKDDGEGSKYQDT